MNLKHILTRAGKEVVSLTDAEVGEAIQVADYDQLIGLAMFVKISPQARVRIYAAAREKQPA